MNDGMNGNKINAKAVAKERKDIPRETLACKSNAPGCTGMTPTGKKMRHGDLASTADKENVSGGRGRTNNGDSAGMHNAPGVTQGTPACKSNVPGCLESWAGEEHAPGWHMRSNNNNHMSNDWIRIDVWRLGNE